MIRAVVWTGLCAVMLAGCSTSGEPHARGSAEPAPHYGAVMSEVGHRLELAGRAAQVDRFELAAYEVGEMQEAIEDDLPHAAPPRTGDPRKLAALLTELRTQDLPALAHAARGRDGAAFRRQFASVAQTCNGCHDATGHSFIQIPEQPGSTVPRLDPLPAGVVEGTSGAPSTTVAPKP